jgi:3-oxoacyl-[acyl-carrier-protein] synthase II
MGEERKVVVTGIGVVTAVGIDEASLWDSMMAGRSGIAAIRAFDASDYKVGIAAEIDNQPLDAALRARGWRKSDRALDIAIEAAGQALDQAGLLADGPPFPPQEIATIIGSGVGPAYSLYTAFNGFTNKGLRGLRPTTVPRCMANSFSAGISIHYNLTGANYVVVSACTSSTNAIGDAFRRIRERHADVVLCGGTDAFFDPFYYGTWNNLGVLSKNPDPAKAYRPFDTDRDGCLLGEGAGVLILESHEHATERGARIRGEILGYGESSDATHITGPSVEGQAKAIRRALESADVEPAEIGYVNAHGTATRTNDECESRSIRLALGDATDAIPVGANKPYFGHTLGAAGAIETIVTLLSLESGRVPANLNLDTPDPACNVRLVGRESMAIDPKVAMKNSFGFGGGNGVLILGRAV